MRTMKKILLSCMIFTTPLAAQAAGFALIEQSGSGMGNAFAGSSAIAEDASTIYFNPAGMTYIEGTQLVGALHLIKPSEEFNNNGSLPGGGPRPLGGSGGDAAARIAHSADLGTPEDLVRKHCPERTVLGIHGRDGAHAEFLRLPVANLLPVPENVPDEHAVFIEPLAAAYGILERVNITPDAKVGIIGDGKLGILCAQSLALTGASVTIIGKHKAKMDIAARRGCAAVTLDEAWKLPRVFDVIVEASGHASGFELALNLLRPRGTLVLKSTFHGNTPFDARIVVDEISVVGSRCGRFAPALELLERGAVDVASLISEEFPLREGARAMRRAEEKGVLKVLLKP